MKRPTLFAVFVLGTFACKTEETPAGESPKGDVVDVAKPTKKIAEIQAAALSTCARMEDGTVRCWGANIEGQLGVGKDADALLESYVPVEVVRVGGAKRLWSTASYSWSGGHSDGHTDTSCAQTSNGSVQCWGHNGRMFGDDEIENQIAPKTVIALDGIVEYTAAGEHACTVGIDKAAMCWGWNAFGVIGIGDDELENKGRTPVEGLGDVVDVGCGQNHCCALEADGTISCWGYGSDGQLGNGEGVNANAPVSVTGLADATQLAVASNSSCALKKDGSVVCWGEGFDKVPVAVEAAIGVTQLDAEGFVCGLATNKTILCWGPNSYGQLGDGTRDDRFNKAAPVNGLAGAVQVAVGVHHACALLEDNSVKCWGKNGRGQLGDGTLEDRLSPVEVVQLSAESLTPQADADRPSALPTDGKLAELTGVPEGCPSKVELAVTIAGKPLSFPVRKIEAKQQGSGYVIDALNYDLDEKNPSSMPRGRQARISFELENSVIATDSVGIYDNREKRTFDAGQITITHLDDKWVCGDIDLRDEGRGHALVGKFAAALN